MRRRAFAVLLPCLLLAATVARAEGALDDALASDRAFAARAGEVGTQAAFQEYLAPDGVLFRPTAVLGLDWLASHDEATGRLDWSPGTGRASCDGQLAVTLGPWTYRQDTLVATGIYLTIWRRGPEGRWTVVLDHGIDVPAAALGPLSPLPAGEVPCAGTAAAPDLAHAEDDYDALLTRKGPGAALRRAASATALALRDGHVPAPVVADWPSDDQAFAGARVVMTRGVASTPGSDLGYTWGELASATKRKGGPSQVRAVYVRVWVREGREWRVLLDMTTGVPAAP